MSRMCRSVAAAAAGSGVAACSVAASSVAASSVAASSVAASIVAASSVAAWPALERGSTDSNTQQHGVARIAAATPLTG